VNRKGKALSGTALLESLGKARWGTASRTYGSSHSTWIGLFSDWWISLDPKSHSVLDGAPSHGKGRIGQGDQLFCDAEGPAGVSEVEGSDPLKKVRTIEQYFKTRREELGRIWFAVLFLYSYSPIGSGKNRQFPQAASPAVLRAVQGLSSRYRDRIVLVVALDKRFERIAEGVRSTSEYYSGVPDQVTGICLKSGLESGRRALFGTER